MLNSRLNQSFELACPRPTPLGRSEADGLSELLSALKQMDSKTTPIDTAGLELRVALLLVGRDSATSGDNLFWLRKCRSLFLRPAVEPLILATWSKLKRFDMTEPQLSAFCSLLCASKQQARTRDSYGLWEGADVRFESAERARSWWADIQGVANSPDLRSLLPVYSFARTIIAHPYPDGNGRLARALVLASLGREADLSSPIIALAPAFYRNAARIADDLHCLCRDGDWNKIAMTICNVLQEALALTGKVR